jgi:2-dehydro-3-deoxygluconokinase
VSEGGLVTIGETMALLDPRGIGLLRLAGTLRLSIGGAESNVAVGVRRLGLPAAWVGRVGADPFGELITTTLRGEGVDVSGVRIDPEVPTSVMVKERRTAGAVRVIYYRKGGPGARLRPEDLRPEVIRAAGVLHLSGITPALSSTAAEAVRAAAEEARVAGVPVSFDLNYRSALWPAEAAAAALTDLVKLADVVFAGDDEAALLGLTGSPVDLARGLASLGPSQAVIKRGAEGAVAWAEDSVHEVSAISVAAVDTVGAGDAFVAGYLAELMSGAPMASRMDTAARCGAFAVTSPGDWEALPTRSELSLLTTEPGVVLR